MKRGVRLIAVLTLLGSLLVGDRGNPVPVDEPYWLSYIRARSSQLMAWDPQHVYTTFLSCPDTWCAFTLGATGDGGATWARTTLPLEAVSALSPDWGAFSFRLSVLGPRTLRLWWPAWNRGGAWLSTDGGATWRSVPSELPVIASVPPGWLLLGDSVARVPVGQVGLAVGDPVTGAAALLAVPDRGFASAALDLSADRGLWLGTRDPELVALQVSRDRGVTWRASAPPWGPGPGITAAVETVAPDGAVYLGATRVPGGEVYLGATRVPGGEVLLARSSDDGWTWEPLAPTGLPAGAPLLQLGVLPDGGLFAVSGPVRSLLRFSVSRDGGRTFSDLAVRGLPRSEHPLRALPGGGYLTSGASRIPHPDLLLVSDDLRTWRRLSPPQT